jgi:hypothetical protein
MRNNENYIKCSFCQYFNKNGNQCLARPNSAYCSEAQREYYAWLANKKQPLPARKSLRRWEK